MHIKKSTEFLHFALPPAPFPLEHDGGSEHRVGTACRSHCQALTLVTLHLSLQSSQPGLLLLFKNFCSTQLTRTAAISPITGLQNLPQLTRYSCRGGSGRGSAAVPAKRDTRTSCKTHSTYCNPWHSPPILSSLCRDSTPCMGKASHVLLLLVLWGKGPFPQLHIVLFLS